MSAWEKESGGEHKQPVALPEVRCIRETTKALLCVIAQEEVWIPKSQIDDGSEVFEKGHQGTLVISGWLAEQKELE